MRRRNSLLSRIIGPVFFAEPAGDDTNPGGGGGGASSWRDSLPDDMREHPALQDFKDVTGLTKSYLGQQDLIGKDKVAIPGEDDADGWNKLYDKLGRPEKADAYEYKKPEGSEGLPFDEELVNKFKTKFHEIGLTKKQGEALFGLWNDNVTSKIQNFATDSQQKREASQTLLKAEWGQAYDQNINIAKNTIKQLGDPDIVPFLEETGLGNDPRLVKIFYNIGVKISEDSFKGGGNGGGFISTPEQAKSRISQLHNDDKFMMAYNTKQHPEHAAAVKKMADLFAQAYPQG